eukprot:GFUD01023099.1.p1 GENE.GFUD01023099.1~~GFUD01023099.1.p1  ORF type:complete len:371 (-),score=49.39 GFUD01023099.1:60-1172(-)
MMSSDKICDGFVPQTCTSYTNCTGSGFISNWTEFCCQPESVKSTRYWMLSIIGTVGSLGTVCNILTISTFMYLYFFPQRIKKKFGEEFFMSKDPAFFLILHLSFCDLLYCVCGLPTFWDVYYNGYYPYSEEMCKYGAFFRNTIALADFHTVACISVYFAWRSRRESPLDGKYGSKPVLAVIIGIWIYSFCVTCIPLLGLCGHLGYDAKHGKCKVITCESCSEGTSVAASAGGIFLTIGVGIPSLIVLVSYTLVYKSLSKVPADVNASSQRKSVFILALCYFVFILPILIIEWLPEDFSDKAFIGVGVYSWYWCIYVINFFVYIIFWKRVRNGMVLFLTDIFGKAGFKLRSSNASNDQSSIWWRDLREIEK